MDFDNLLTSIVLNKIFARYCFINNINFIYDIEIVSKQSFKTIHVNRISKTMVSEVRIYKTRSDYKC